MLHCIFTDPSTVIIPLTIASLQVYDTYYMYFISVIGTVYVCFAILQIFYPLAGYLADVRYGRKKCVIGSLWSFFATTVLLGLFGLVALSLLGSYLPYHSHKWPYALMSVVVILLGLPVIIVVFFFFSSIVAFHANVIQFGLDQLHDSQTDHLVLFIHWYVLLSYVATELIKAPSSILLSLCWLYDWTNIPFAVDWSIILIITIPSILAVICLFLLISFCVAFRKRHTWFLSDSGSKNPYRLVYKVVSFAREHRNPVRCSAFTYCEDELPSRLDLGKEKYGDPFTTEQVEDVKAFLGILKLLLTLGPLFSVERSISFLLPLFFNHIFGIFYSC